MGARTWWVAAIIGAAVATASGSGLLAVAGDSATSTGNQVTSGTFGEPTVDLRIASYESAPNQCPTDPSSYDDGPTAPMELTSDTFDLGGGGTDQSGAFCLLNASSDDGVLAVSFEAVEEREVGECDLTEADAGDETCADGDSGELAAVVGVEVVKHGSGCTSLSTTFVALHSTPQSIGAVDAGKSCRLALRLRPIGDDADRQRAQTDRLTWDIRFHLEPAG